MKKIIAIVAACVLTLGVLGACAESGQDSKSSQGSSTSAASSGIVSFDVKDDPGKSEASSSSVANSSSSAASASSSAASASASSAAAEPSAESESSEDAESTSDESDDEDADSGDEAEEEDAQSADAPAKPAVSSDIEIVEDYRDSFVHGPKPAQYQKYIVLHDTEGDGDPQSVIDYWDGNGNLVAAHFVIGKDGTIYQCVDMDSIAHHAGFGDAGHNELYGVEDESRDDKEGTVPIGDWAPDYGMNSYSIGIEMVHVGGSGDYPEEQLEALDQLIAYIDDYYGFESEIIDHKAWRSGNSDTSDEFAEYFANYQDHRTHD